MRHASRGEPYRRAAAEALSRLLGNPAILSPREWSLVTSWQERGVPLPLLLETLEDLERSPGRKRRGTGIPTVAQIARAVEEAWLTVRDGRSVARGGEIASLASLDEARRRWERALAELDPRSSLAELLLRCLERLAAGEDPARVDAELDAELVGRSPASDRAVAEEASERDLKPFRARMSEEAYRATRARSVVDRLRVALGLPRLALTRGG